MQGGAHAPPKIRFGENLGKISENLAKIRGHLGKSCENYRKLYENTGKNGAQNNMKTFFGGHPNNSFHEKTFAQKWPKNVSDKFGKIRAKILRTPKNLPAPTHIAST